MLRWLLVMVISMVVFQRAAVWLRDKGMRKLPGDFTVRVGGREVFLPLGSCVVLSALAAGVSLLF